MLCGKSVRVRGRGRGAASPVVEGERGLILFVGGDAGEFVVRRELDVHADGAGECRCARYGEGQDRRVLD